jgi:hypothetical protein
LAERALARHLYLGAMMIHAPDPDTRKVFEECLHGGLGEIPAWLKLAGAKKTSPSQDIAALRQATQSTAVILSLVDVIARDPEPLLPDPLRKRIAQTLDDMAAILRKGVIRSTSPRGILKARKYYRRSRPQHSPNCRRRWLVSQSRPCRNRHRSRRPRTQEASSFPTPSPIRLISNTL